MHGMEDTFKIMLTLITGTNQGIDILSIKYTRNIAKFKSFRIQIHTQRIYHYSVKNRVIYEIHIFDGDICLGNSYWIHDMTRSVAQTLHPLPAGNLG